MIWIKVKLVRYTPEPDKACAAAAYSTFSKKTPEALFEGLSDEKAREILKRVVGYGHHSVIEHANFTFAIEGISRACSHQLVRHRLASYSQQSQRYVKFNEMEYATPNLIKGNEQAMRIYEEAMKAAAKAYDELKSIVPAEDARYVLPNAALTNVVMTMNARALLHFFKLRCCSRAQWEIRQMSYLMLQEAKKVAPIIFENAGASCDQDGTCPEGDLSCGRWKNAGKKADPGTAQ